jgi:1,2-diacylglycerol 3-beta-glucosyltransferase
VNASLLLGILNAAAFMLCVSFVAYVTMIVLPFLRHERGAPGDASMLDWHFIVPCLDEQLVIAGTVEALVRTFPRVHVWCVDDASTDATGLILDRLARRYRRVHVVRRRLPAAREGKGPALNAGWSAITGWLSEAVDPDKVIVGVLDADSRLDPEALDVIAGAELFGDAGVGAVQVQVRVKTRAGGARRLRRMLVRLQDLEFTGPIAAMQMLRRRSGSVGMGGNGQFTRLSVLNQIAAEHGTPWHGALLEDFELGLHVLLSGSRNEYSHDTWVEQEGLADLRLLVRQRSRWAQGSMQCLRYLNPVMRSARISTPGALEIAYFLFIPWSQLVGGLVYAASMLLMLYYGVSQPGGFAAWLSDGAWGVLPLFVVFGLAPLAVWGPIYRSRTEPGMTRRRAVAFGLANWIYSYLHYAAVWWAFARLVRRRGDWKKTARTASELVVVPASCGPTALGTFRPRRPERPEVIVARLRERPVTALGPGSEAWLAS